MSVVKGLLESNSKQAASQTLYTDMAYKQGNLVGAPIGDEEPTFVFATKTVLNFAAVDQTTGTPVGSNAQFVVSPNAASHIVVSTAFNPSGGSTATAAAVVADGHANWASQFDDYRCAAMTVRVLNRSRKDEINGDVCVTNWNPQSTANQSASIYRSDASTNAGVVDGDLYRMAWLPARTEDDHIWQSIASTVNTDATVIVFNYAGALAASAGLALFELEVYAIWEARVIAGVDFLRTRVYNIDHTLYMNYRLIDLVKLPFYAKGRNIAADGGPFSFFSDLYKSGKSLVNNAKDLFTKKGSVTGKIAGLAELLAEAGSIAATVGVGLAAEEKVLRAMYALNPEELQLLQVLVGRYVSHEQIGAKLCRHYNFRKQPRGSRNRSLECDEKWDM
jgi:hypothetical protein